MTVAIENITARRIRADDDHLEALPDDPVGVVGYVCSHARGVPRAVVAEDVAEALQIICALRAALDRRELTLIQMGRGVDLSWDALAKALSLRSRQAAEQRALRLEISVTGDGRSEVTARARRRGQETEPGWIARNRDEVNDLAHDFATRKFRSPDAQDAIDALAEALAEPESTTRQLLAWISLILQALLRSGEMPQDTDRALKQADRLVSAWELVRPPA